MYLNSTDPRIKIDRDFRVFIFGDRVQNKNPKITENPYFGYT